ncbi:MAG: hypothetical protein HFJ85_03265 [Oscillospiraceae bacterium]|nr:hypothetical protein [Oscillospiraceae bacterium]
MDNNELLQQISAMMEVQQEEFSRKLEEHTKRIELKIEHDVTDKIEALFDGYKLTHEKQWELERKVEKLEERVERLEQVG